MKMTEDQLARLIEGMMREERVFECFLARSIAKAIVAEEKHLSKRKKKKKVKS